METCQHNRVSVSQEGRIYHFTAGQSGRYKALVQSDKKVVFQAERSRIIGQLDKLDSENSLKDLLMRIDFQQAHLFALSKFSR